MSRTAIPPAVIAAARALWLEHVTTAEIGRRLTAQFAREITKDSVIGLARRNGFPKRPLQNVDGGRAEWIRIQRSGRFEEAAPARKVGGR